jgi:hypothetical protein
MRSHSLGAVSLLLPAFAAGMNAGCADDRVPSASGSPGGPGDTVQPPEVPAALAVPDGHVAFLKGAATGTQIYVCQAKMDMPGAYEWTFKAPDAVLVDDKGVMIATHYAGPTWESTDGSKVVGTLKERADSPDPDAIPWLLLGAKSTGGSGVFSKVTFIQRVNTAGGKAPDSGCDMTTESMESAIPYTADYYFYKAK